jgi:iron complex transport system permease protein
VILRIFLLVLLAFGTFIVSTSTGEVQLDFAQVATALFAPGTTPSLDSGMQDVLFDIRLPRVLTAALVGASLASSGFLLQSLSNNYLI